MDPDSEKAFAERPSATKAIWTCKVGAAATQALADGADAPLRRAVEQTYRELTGSDPDFLFSGWGGELTADEQEAVEQPVLTDDSKSAITSAVAERRSQDARRLAADLAAGAGWRGTPPAEGSRRALILAAVKRGDVLSDTEALEIADDVESALLHTRQFEYPVIVGATRRSRREAILDVLEQHDFHLYDGHGGKIVSGHGGKIVSANAVDLANELERAFGFLRENPYLSPDQAEALEKLDDPINARDDAPSNSVATGNGHRVPDEFDIRAVACERLHERLTDGPVPNPAELARVIDILR